MRTLTICTTPFVTLGTAQAKTLSATPQFTIAEMPHPLGAISEAEVKHRADAAWPQLEKWINAQQRVAA